jgi:hypothetical protein
MDKLERRHGGMSNLRSKVREVAAKEAKKAGVVLSDKENVVVEEERVPEVLPPPAATPLMERRHNVSEIPVGKQLPRTPPSKDSDMSSSISMSSSTMVSPGSRRVSSFYSPAVELRKKVVDRVRVSSGDFSGVWPNQSLVADDSLPSVNPLGNSSEVSSDSSEASPALASETVGLNSRYTSPQKSKPVASVRSPPDLSRNNSVIRKPPTPVNIEHTEKSSEAHLDSISDATTGEVFDSSVPINEESLPLSVKPPVTPGTMLARHIIPTGRQLAKTPHQER